MPPDLHHIHIIGRYRQGQHTLMTSRSQGQSQGHQGHFRFFADFAELTNVATLFMVIYLYCGVLVT